MPQTAAPSQISRAPAAPDLFLAEAARETLFRVFGFEDYRPAQRAPIEAVLAGEDVFAVMPTGSGKSLLYQLPALVRPGLTVVVSPLIALMRDQVSALERKGVAAVALNSVNGAAENAFLEAKVRAGRCHLVYVAPERLVRRETQALLREGGARTLAIDEAHCVSQWGHDFRPEYSDLAEAARALAGDGPPLQIVAVTATADAPTRADVAGRLFPSPPRLFVSSFDRPNIRLAMRRRTSAAQQCAAEIARRKGQSGIIYCASRRGVERLAETLRASGVAALPYHAGLASEIRAANQDEFLKAQGVVIVATIAFGMGVDKPDVRFVIHADLPQSVESYYQEIGRAGRDGLPADALLLFGEADVRFRERQIDEGDASPERKRVERRKLNALLALCETPRCRRKTLLAAFGEEAGDCGNCDICEGRWRLFNGALAAKKALSAVHRTSGRFFSGHLAKLLVGEATAAIVRHGHDLLPTFGVGKEFSAAEWRSVFRQLQAADLIDQEEDDRDRWVITPAGRAVLRGEATIELREIGLGGRRLSVGAVLKRVAETTQDEEPAMAQAPPPRAPAEDLTVAEARLFAALKAKRLDLARAQKQAPFVIFHDSALIAMARAKPLTLEEMGTIPGVGPAKLQRYGELFLETLNAADRD